MVEVRDMAGGDMRKAMQENSKKNQNSMVLKITASSDYVRGEELLAPWSARRIFYLAGHDGFCCVQLSISQVCHFFY